MYFDNKNINFAYVCGMYLTDGYIHSKKGYCGLRLRNIDLDIHEYYLKCIYNLTGKNVKMYTFEKGYTSTVYESECYNKDIVNFLINSTKTKTIIPEYIYDMDIAYKKEFMAGLLDGDGWCSVSESRERTNRTTNNPDWHATIGIVGKQSSFIRFLPILLKDMNIKFSRYERNEQNEQPLFTYRLDNKDFVDNELYFRCQRKQDKLELIKSYRIGQRYNLKRRTENRSTTQDENLE